MKTSQLITVASYFLLGPFLYAQDASDEWVGHWINGVELSKDQSSYPKAIETYTTAIKALDPNQLSVQLNLIIERGNLYFQLMDYPNAIKDFSYVINLPKASQDQIIEALWGRSKAYLAGGQVQNYEKDADRLSSLQFLFEPITETKDYMVLKVDPYQLRDPKMKERFLNSLMKRKQIQSENDVIFTPSGLIIVKKVKTETNSDASAQ